MRYETKWIRLALGVVLGAVVFAAHGAPETSAADKTTSASTEHGASKPTLRTARQERFLQLHEAYLKRAKEQPPIDLLFLGDSITERWTSAPEVWKKCFGKWNAANFGVGGDRTQHLLWRITNGELEGISPKVVVLLIGTNNANSDPPEPIVQAVAKTVRIVREKLPKTKVLLLAIFPRAPRKGPLPNRPMETIRQVNPELARLADGQWVRYLDLSEKFLVNGEVPKELMPDGVHLSTKGYEIWGESLQPVLEEMMK